METAELSQDGMAAPLEAGEEGGKPGLIRSGAARIAAWDRAFLRWLASLQFPRSVTLPLVVLVRIGDGWIWAVAAAWLFYVLPMPEMKQTVAHCLVAIAISLTFYWPIKFLVRRKRPHESGLGVTAKVPPLDKYSFPSGHTMNNLAVALTLALYVPGFLPLALGLPLLLGTLRVFFGVHFLSDIAGGALLGGLSYFLAQGIFQFF